MRHRVVAWFLFTDALIAALDVNGDGDVLFGAATAGPRDDGAHYQALGETVEDFAARNGFSAPTIVDNTQRGAMLGCLLFGSADSFRFSLPAVGHPLNSALLSSLPFVLTICVMALFAHRTREPQSPARPFIRGLR